MRSNADVLLYQAMKNFERTEIIEPWMKEVEEYLNDMYPEVISIPDPSHYYKVGDSVSMMGHSESFGVVIKRDDRECQVKFHNEKFRYGI